MRALMAGFRTPAMVDPRELSSGDLVACLEHGGHMAAHNIRLVTTELPEHPHCEVIWVPVLNDVGDTKHVWGELVPSTHVALQFDEYTWKIMPLPRVLARRRIRS
jgi:hypothetical protein